MDATRRRSLMRIVGVGAAYLLIGVVFGALATAAESHRGVVAWRLAAWVASAVVYAAHLWYERIRLTHPARAAALRVAAAAALGAFGLAVAATVHSLSVATSARHAQLLRIALVVWPVMTGVPAFLVALVLAGVLGMRTRYPGETSRPASS